MPLDRSPSQFELRAKARPRQVQLMRRLMTTPQGPMAAAGLSPQQQRRLRRGDDSSTPQQSGAGGCSGDDAAVCASDSGVLWRSRILDRWVNPTDPVL